MKKPQNEQQVRFFDELIANGGDVKEAAEAEGYDRAYAFSLAKQYHEYIVNKVQGAIYLDTIRAQDVLSKALSDDGTDVGIKTKMDAARDILDRSGITKQDMLKVTVDSPNGIFILPAKEEDPDRNND
jgi:hypothetical protein